MKKCEDIEYLNKSESELLKALEMQMQKTSKKQSKFIDSLKRRKFKNAFQIFKIIQGEHIQIEKLLEAIKDK